MAKMIYDSRNRIGGRVVAAPAGLTPKQIASNPVNWPSTECDISISGLGAMRRTRGLMHMTPAATYRDTPQHERADIKRAGAAVPDNVATEL